MNKKLKKEIDAMLAEESQKNVDCCAAWSSHFVTRERLVQAEHEKRCKYNKNFEEALMALAVIAGVCGFLFFGQIATTDQFILKLFVGVALGGACFFAVLLIGYFVFLFVKKNTYQQAEIDYVLGEELER